MTTPTLSVALNTFERATKARLRFTSPQGELTTEQLWQLPVTSTKANTANLYDIAKDLKQQLKGADDEIDALVNNAKKVDSKIELAYEVVKRVIEVKRADEEAKKKREEIAQKRQTLMALIDQKEFEKLANSDTTELRKQLDELTALTAE